MMVTGNTPAEQDPNYDQTMYTNFAAVARMYPQQDGWATGGRYSWLHCTPIWYQSIPTRSRSAATTAITAMRAIWWMIISIPAAIPGPWPIIDQNNIAGGQRRWHQQPRLAHRRRHQQTDRGRALTWRTNCMHAFGFVDSDAPNYQPSDVPGEDHHSKYNEGHWERLSAIAARLAPSGRRWMMPPAIPTGAWCA